MGVFKHICIAAGAAGNSVPDALLAAAAIRHEAEFVTMDAGFKRYAGLRLRLLQAETPRSAIN
ncbi:MAG: hypothetical protein D6B26_03815 [Spirochaetaceae bacterium]|nr:MAG: hypothetical protein D6B26_03815 [Spirochaetaceae bacterium]